MHQAVQSPSTATQGGAGNKSCEFIYREKSPVTGCKGDDVTPIEVWEVADPDLPDQGPIALLLDGERETWVQDALYNIETLAREVSDGIETLGMSAATMSAFSIKSRTEQLARMMWILMQEGQRADSLVRDGKPMKMRAR